MTAPSLPVDIWLIIQLAQGTIGKQRTYNPDVAATASRAQAAMHFHDHWNSNSKRVRRKRLQPWLADNKHRMTPEDRLKAEDRVGRTKDLVRRILRHEKLCELTLTDFTREMGGVVSEKCAEDLPYLLQWPWGHDDMYATPIRPLQLRCRSKGCSTM
ncbi:hypothetical protein BU25DRAFT_405625 [Macroventuria anomochaeta]|uniref:Uncharacterized protein n=1 Tax=Macroventuria anomochaeta TaxID=301207 RepID=A0ACB6SJR5_9PLEO|nr:uncharacterized protein BU25DRAFT_405625 [Macroventuria anomochaeta]KAF2633759.1 hypothetical protein BU25DRAFT_405625 [Macroventuria anomochaeta]